MKAYKEKVKMITNLGEANDLECYQKQLDYSYKTCHIVF